MAIVTFVEFQSIRWLFTLDSIFVLYSKQMQMI